jgi:hypothetical protein
MAVSKVLQLLQKQAHPQEAVELQTNAHALQKSSRWQLQTAQQETFANQVHCVVLLVQVHLWLWRPSRIHHG